MSHLTCRLCLKTCTQQKQLYDEHGACNNEIYNKMRIFFSPKFLHMSMVICQTCCQCIYGFHDFLKQIANNQSNTNDIGDGRIRAQQPKHIKIENNKDDFELEINFDDSKLHDQMYLKEQLADEDTCDEIKHEITIEEESISNLSENSNYPLIKARKKPITTKENNDIISQWKSNLECGICKQQHADFADLCQHFNLEHANEKAHILCCRRKLLTRLEIADHARYHLNPEIFKCSECAKCFEHHRQLSRHMSNVHASENIFKCRICSNIFKSRNSITVHLKTKHTQEFTETSNICLLYGTIQATDVQANNKNLKVNPNAVKKSDNIIAQWQPFKYLQCGICQKPNAGFLLLSKHFRQEHPNETPHIVCCKLKLMTHWKIAEHASFHLNPQAFKCHECDKAFGIKNLLKIHTRNVHNTKSKLVCKFCGTLFGYRKSLVLHLKSFHPQVWSDRKNIPDLYDLTEAANEKAYLDVIMQWKSNLDCGICQKPQASFSNLTNHFAHEHSNQTPHILCCKRKFSTLPKIAEHASFHINPEASKCTECDKCFESPILLSAHIKNTHSANDKFICGICDAVFGYQRNLNKHLKNTHSENAKFICSICDAVFGYRRNLNQHLKEKHAQ